MAAQLEVAWVELRADLPPADTALEVAFVVLQAPPVEPETTPALEVAWIELVTPGAAPLLEVSFIELKAPMPEGAYQVYSDGTTWTPVRSYYSNGTSWTEIT